MADANKARHRPGDLLGADFKAALAQIADDDEPDYRGKSEAAQDDGTEREVRLADETPVVRIAHTIIAQAIRNGASEIQVEPRTDGVDVRFRIGSTIHEVMKLPKRVQRKLVARYTHMAELDVEERGAPQDGRIGITHQGADHDLQVRSEPREDGERVIMTIQSKQGELPPE
jgi:type II secretory ATPase GspE/PulE/Tfp pilus assembly ATPase PilB-like protein